MKQNILLLYKNLGETPLDTITRYKQEYKLGNEKYSFAGRLDPMAEGLLLVLKNEENKNRHEYEALQKTYECSFVLGFATDSYDLLGKITQTSDKKYERSLINTITSYIESLPGTRMQSYPPFSSYHLNGKPLYYWERRGTLDHENLPKKEITIYEAIFLNAKLITKRSFESDISNRISLVKGNFRQDDIRDGWKDFFKRTSAQEFLQVSMRVSCSSGTYIRGLIHSLGSNIGIPAVTTSIIRTNIGSFSLKDISLYTPKE